VVQKHLTNAEEEEAEGSFPSGKASRPAVDAMGSVPRSGSPRSNVAKIRRVPDTTRPRLAK